MTQGQISSGADAQTVMPQSALDAAGQEDMLARIGQLTRLLRNSMYELGLNHTIEQAAAAIPDARERLRYVARMTEQAATEVLSTIELAQPLLDDHQRSMKALLSGIDQGVMPDPDELKALLSKGVADYGVLSGYMMQIMMAQSFQDLTGQVITKMMTLIGTIESELIDVLIQNAPAEAREQVKAQGGLLNGPQMDPTRADVVSSQDQVDDLLSSLGF